MKAEPSRSAVQRHRRKAVGRGRRGEFLAACALMLKGYRILARGYRTPLGEIDIVARRGAVLAIVEVKARASLMAAMEAVPPAAERRIEAATDLFVSRRADVAGLAIRFDLVAILPRRWPVHVENLFQGRN